MTNRKYFQVFTSSGTDTIFAYTRAKEKKQILNNGNDECHVLIKINCALADANRVAVRTLLRILRRCAVPPPFGVR